METHHPHFVDRINTTIGGLSLKPLSVDSLLMADDGKRYPEIGKRLAAIRQAFSDLNQKDWAEKHCFPQSRYNNWERGIRRIPVDEAEQLCDLYGLTLDFVYRGRRDRLSDKARNLL